MMDQGFETKFLCSKLHILSCSLLINPHEWAKHGAGGFVARASSKQLNRLLGALNVLLPFHRKVHEPG